MSLFLFTVWCVRITNIYIDNETSTNVSKPLLVRFSNDCRQSCGGGTSKEKSAGIIPWRKRLACCSCTCRIKFNCVFD